MNNKNVVFGRVINGLKAFKIIEYIIDTSEDPTSKLHIKEAGTYEGDFADQESCIKEFKSARGRPIYFPKIPTLDVPFMNVDPVRNYINEENFLATKLMDPTDTSSNEDVIMKLFDFLRQSLKVENPWSRTKLYRLMTKLITEEKKEIALMQHRRPDSCYGLSFEHEDVDSYL